MTARCAQCMSALKYVSAKSVVGQFAGYGGHIAGYGVGGCRRGAARGPGTGGKRGRVFSLVSLSVLMGINNQTIQSSILFHLKYVFRIHRLLYFVLSDIVLIDRQEL